MLRGAASARRPRDGREKLTTRTDDLHERGDNDLGVGGRAEHGTSFLEDGRRQASLVKSAPWCCQIQCRAVRPQGVRLCVGLGLL